MFSCDIETTLEGASRSKQHSLVEYPEVDEENASLLDASDLTCDI